MQQFSSVIHVCEDSNRPWWRQPPPSITGFVGEKHRPGTYLDAAERAAGEPLRPLSRVLVQALRSQCPLTPSPAGELASYQPGRKPCSPLCIPPHLPGSSHVLPHHLDPLPGHMGAGASFTLKAEKLTSPEHEGSCAPLNTRLASSPPEVTRCLWVKPRAPLRPGRPAALDPGRCFLPKNLCSLGSSPLSWSPVRLWATLPSPPPAARAAPICLLWASVAWILGAALSTPGLWASSFVILLAGWMRLCVQNAFGNQWVVSSVIRRSGGQTH